MAEKKYSEQIQQDLKYLVDYFDKEDRPVRERQIRQWKKLKYYWEGFQRIYWAEIAHDWRVYDEMASVNDTADSQYYDKQINIFKAYLESIVAALSVSTPGITCVPDDADNPIDVATAKAGDKIAELIGRHNDVSLLWLHALFIMCTEGMVAAYSYTKEDEEFGTYQKDEYEDQSQDIQYQLCPNCKTNLGDPEVSNEERDKFNPEPDDVELQNILEKGNICPQCLVAVEPEIQTEKIIVPRFIGTTTLPKSRQCIEVYGGLFVKVAMYAQKQKDTPYLIFSYETHYSNVIARYHDLTEKLRGQRGGGMYDPYERWGRLSTQYREQYPIDTPTVKTCWLRPSSFETLGDEERAKALKKEFPFGAKVVIVSDNFAEACPEKLDDVWTLTENPLSDYLHHQPLGESLVSIQDITNDLVSLILQTIEHGIPQTMFDPEVLNADAYSQMQAAPGALIPAKPRSGKTLAESFHDIKTASLSAEVQPFAERIQQMGQLTSGALPSLFGGAQPNSSKTAAQYSMSRAQALQRLQTQWKLLSVWWKKIHGKVIPAFIEDMVEDEKYVTKDKAGNFINVWIRKSEIGGKIGSVELETSEQLPTTWAQKKDVVMQLLQAANPAVMQAITAPENLGLVTEAIGLTDLTVPGEDDRIKQYEEISMLLNSQPIQNPQMNPQTGQPMMQEMPSVEVEDLVDNHEIQAEICRDWLVSEAGRLAKVENPAGYKNVLLHMKEHVIRIPPPPQPMPPAAGNKAPMAAKTAPKIGAGNAA